MSRQEKRKKKLPKWALILTVALGCFAIIYAGMLVAMMAKMLIAAWRTPEELFTLKAVFFAVVFLYVAQKLAYWLAKGGFILIDEALGKVEK